MGGAPLTSLGPHCRVPSLCTRPLWDHPQSVLASLLRCLHSQTHPHLHLAPASLLYTSLTPQPTCPLPSEPPTLPIIPHLAQDLSSTLLHPLTIPRRRPKSPSPHAAFLLKPSPTLQLNTSDYYQLTRSHTTPASPASPILSLAPFQAPASYPDLPPVSPGMPPPSYPTPRSALTALLIPLQLSSSLSPWDPAPSRVTTPPHPDQHQIPSPPVRPGWAHCRVGSSPLPAGRTHAGAAPPPRALSLPSLLVAAAPAPASQAAAVASPPPPAARSLAAGSSPIRLSVRGDRPVRGGCRRLKARGA